jgi:hypothetical protein
MTSPLNDREYARMSLLGSPESDRDACVLAFELLGAFVVEPSVVAEVAVERRRGCGRALCFRSGRSPRRCECRWFAAADGRKDPSY